MGPPTASAEGLQPRDNHHFLLLYCRRLWQGINVVPLHKRGAGLSFLFFCSGAKPGASIGVTDGQTPPDNARVPAGVHLRDSGWMVFFAPFTEGYKICWNPFEIFIQGGYIYPFTCTIIQGL